MKMLELRGKKFVWSIVFTGILCLCFVLLCQTDNSYLRSPDFKELNTASSFPSKHGVTDTNQLHGAVSVSSAHEKQTSNSGSKPTQRKVEWELTKRERKNSGSSRSLFDDVLKAEAHDYLSPINSFKDFLTNGTLSHDVTRLMSDVFRTDYGLTPFTNEKGQRGWTENGVVYQPISDENRRSRHADFTKPTEFEYYVPFDEKLFFQGEKTIPAYRNKPKIILWYARIPYVWYMPELKSMRKCPDFPCRITSNNQYASQSSAMVFDGSFIKGEPPQRQPGQVFVYHYVETPAIYEPQHRYRHPTWRGVFNWTMSYRSDSDILVHYGRIRKRPTPLVKDYTSLIRNKSKLAVALIGHCNTKSLRKEYIAAMSEYMDIDVFGACGKPNKYPRNEEAKYGEMISATYKFYLSFENAICEEYISEKFFRYMSLDVLIVTRGGPGYLQHAPPETFIDAANFKSPRQLAEYLSYLDQNPDKYEALLRKKNEYVSLYEDWMHLTPKKTIPFVHYQFEAVPFCKLCHWLWHVSSHAKTVPDIGKWHKQRTCKNPQTIPT